MARTARAEKAAETRGRILAATARMVAGHGIRGLRVEDVAKEAGIAVSLIYYHFKSRGGLVQAVLLRTNELALAGLAETPVRQLDGRAQLSALLEGEFSELPEVRELAVVWSEATASAAFDPALVPLVREAARNWEDTVSRLIRTGLADGSVAPGTDPAGSAARLTALVEGLSSKWLASVLGRAEAIALLRSAMARELGPPPP
ncbi:TetR/AcrR family transcriptional regulator [Mangrovicoccus sp. HB161399]|uniref:TetR/AcrR family transcriptional regulator n=1 Tax=Mangrovicoccus sp. HB161399 TaxID=2720392 RepID=UPI001555715B|nr:TetR/AcrR family transcriptional regulator [Mangrovicoccus sp. HB161399]